MIQQELIRELRQYATILGIKVRQPWASWIFYRGKCEEIRTHRIAYRGLAGILASGWDKFFDSTQIAKYYPYPYDRHCLLGFARITGCKCYRTADQFRAAVDRHLNPPYFYSGVCHGWLLADRTPIKPLYYTHSENNGRFQICLQGQMARVRIATTEILDHITVLPEK